MTIFFLNIYKEKGMTSFDVIFKLRKILKIKKIGHSGTLDPLATGVMQVGVGNAAKLLDYLDGNKKYIAEIKFGYTSDTLDDEGEKTFVKEPNFTKDELINALSCFLGKSLQIPPKYSAIKINGKKLCDLARQGKELPEIKPREIEVYDIKLMNFNGKDSASFEIHCSKGTYIRSIVRDLGQKLSCGAYMSSLIRTQAGNFKIENSAKINDEIIKNAINPLDVLNLNKIELTKEQYKRVIHGNSIEYKIEKENEKSFMLTYNNNLVSIANLSDNVLKMQKVFETE